MLKNSFLLVFILVSGVSVAGQYPVKLEVSATDNILEAEFRQAITDEIQKIPDVRLGDTGRFGLIVQLIRRPGSGPADDIFVSAVSTARSVCILEQEANGRVVSRQSCREFLTSNTYIGRMDESRKLAQDIVLSFDSYVLNPLREID